MPTMGQAGMCLIWWRTESPILTNIINNMFALLRLYFEQEGCICLEQLVTLQLKAFFLGFYDYLYRNPEEKKAETGSLRIRELFNRFMRALESRYRESRDVSYYADLLNVSAKYLGIVTRRITGHTAKSVIDHYVVLQIKQSPPKKSQSRNCRGTTTSATSHSSAATSSNTPASPPPNNSAKPNRPSPISLSNLIRRSTMSVSNTSW